MFAGHHCAVIERDADPKLRPPFGAPGCVQAGQFLAHGERGTNGRDCVLCRAGAAHISPDRHDGVAHEFVEGAAETKHALDHGGEIFIQLLDEHMRIALRTHL